MSTIHRSFEPQQTHEIGEAISTRCQQSLQLCAKDTNKITLPSCKLFKLLTDCGKLLYFHVLFYDSLSNWRTTKISKRNEDKGSGKSAFGVSDRSELSSWS